MAVTKLSQGVHWVGALDPNLKTFDIIMPLDHGTTYNAYLIQAGKTAVVEAVKDGFYEEFTSNIESLTELSKIDYIIVNHTEPDHTGAMVALLEAAPEATVVSSQAGYNFLRQIVNRDFDYLIVKDGDTLDLGGKTLRFLSAPLLHWPDTMFSYLVEDGILFSCDGFGAHYYSEGRFNDEAGDYIADLKYYFDCIMAPFKPRVLDAVKKVRELDIRMIAPSHGPILREEPMQYVDLYEKWSTPPEKGGKDLLIVFASAYGYTRAIAEAIREGAAPLPGVRVHFVEIDDENKKLLLDKVALADGILVGSPTIVGNVVEPVLEFLAGINPIIHKGKKASAFGSYGWSGEAVPMLIERMKTLKLSVLEPGLRVNFAPSADDLAEAKEFGRKFAEAL